ncbi:phage baseplate assembly protein V [Mycetohabitans endofungorum]|uniref:phage baseplate assembly protein V n=1 Tax=Mycetohabitans endofungorum TaxID=417203 RepID=UPI0030D185CD
MDANEICRLIVNLIRKGVVLDVNCASYPPTCRVAVGDATDAQGAGLQTNWIPWMTLAAGTTREWLPPTKGEQVLLLCPMGDPAQGVALRGLFSDIVDTPSRDPAVHTRVYPDGACIRYDHTAHALHAELPADASLRILSPASVTVHTGTAIVKADCITLDAEQTTCTGALLVQGPFTFESGMTGHGGQDSGSGATMTIDGQAHFTGDVTSQGVSLPHHTHRDQGDGQLVSAPQ